MGGQAGGIIVKKDKRTKTSLIIPIIIIIIIISLLALTFISVYGSAPSAGFSDFGTAKIVSDKQPEVFEDSTINGLYDNDLLNIAFLGFDKSSLERQDILPRPDTIIITAIDLKTEQVSLVSVPRDSYVNIYGTEIFDKINHSYMYGYQSANVNEDPHAKGIEVTLLTIESFLCGVPINAYFATDMDGVVAIVDKIGGLDFDVEVAVRSQFGQGNLLLDKGQQHLDGQLLLKYVKNRAFHQGGEHGRNERQQKILIALFKKLNEEGILKNIINLYENLNAYVDTNLKLEQIAALGFLGLKVNPDEIETYVFNGDGKLSDHNGKKVYYLFIDEEDKNSIIEKVFLTKGK